MSLISAVLPTNLGRLILLIHFGKLKNIRNGMLTEQAKLPISISPMSFRSDMAVTATVYYL